MYFHLILMHHVHKLYLAFLSFDEIKNNYFNWLHFKCFSDFNILLNQGYPSGRLLSRCAVHLVDYWFSVLLKDTNFLSFLILSRTCEIVPACLGAQCHSRLCHLQVLCERYFTLPGNSTCGQNALLLLNILSLLLQPA